MGTIYQHAFHVVAWLGTPENLNMDTDNLDHDSTVQESFAFASLLHGTSVENRHFYYSDSTMRWREESCRCKASGSVVYREDRRWQILYSIFTRSSVWGSALDYSGSRHGIPYHYSDVYVTHGFQCLTTYPWTVYQSRSKSNYVVYGISVQKISIRITWPHYRFSSRTATLLKGRFQFPCAFNSRVVPQVSEWHVCRSTR